MQIEQHKYHPKEIDVEYYLNHMIRKSDEHKPIKYFDKEDSIKILVFEYLLLMLLDELEHLNENKNYAKRQVYLFQMK